MKLDAAPYWIPKSLRKTVGGQPVTSKPLHCESFGASDYCRHCGRDMCTADGKPNVCAVLERVRLGLIPDDEVSAFGCEFEATHGLDPCEKWCHRPECAFALKEMVST